MNGNPAPRRSPLPAAAALLATVGAAMSLSGLFSGPWRGVTVLSALSAVLGAELARRLRVPQAVVPLVGLLALGLFLTAHFARHVATLGVLPNLSSLSTLRELAGRGFDDIATYVPPVAMTPGLLLLTAGGVGLIALLVDTRAVTYGGAGLAAVPLVAMYALPAFLAPGGASALGFVLGAAGYLLLLHLDRRDRVSGWGRVVSRTASPDTTLERLAARTVALCVVSPVVLGLAVPAAVPFLSAGILDGGRVGAGKDRKVNTSNPIVNLQDDLLRPKDTRVLTYRTSSGKSAYIRTVGLDDFDGEKWDTRRLQVKQTQRVNKGMEPQGPAGDVARSQESTTISIGSYSTSWLPLPYPATYAEVDDSWIYDKETYNVFSTHNKTENSTYRVDSLELAPTADQLRSAAPAGPEMQRFLQLPENVSSAAVAMARTIANRHDNAYDRARELERRLSREFTYDLRAPNGTGNTALDRFFRTERGFCVHFASAMAVVARQMGIPARVAVGFQPGKPQADGSWVVTTHNAHAWPELYFPSVGWVRFEPTPSDGLPEPTPTNEPVATDSPSPEATPSATKAATPKPTLQGTELPPPPTTPTPPSHGPLGGLLDLVGLPPQWAGPLVKGAAGVLAVAALLAMPRFAAQLARRRRWRKAEAGPAATAEAAVAQLQADCHDYGIAWRSAETPRQFGSRLCERIGDQTPGAEAGRRLTALAERLRYAPGVGTVEGVARDSELVNVALAASSTRWVRMRARWFPPSLLLPVRSRLGAWRESASQAAQSRRRLRPLQRGTES